MFDTLTDVEPAPFGGRPAPGPRSAARDPAPDLQGMSDSLRACAPEKLDDRALMGVIEDLSRLGAVLEGVRARAVAALEARGTTDEVEGMSTASWLARASNDDPRCARRDVRVAAALHATLPEVGAALAEGSITAAHARALVRAANPRIREFIADMQADLIARAAEVPFRKWKVELDHLVELLDQDGGHDPNRERRGPRVTLSPLFDGAISLRGDLGHDDGVLVASAIDDVADELFRAHMKDRELDPSILVPSRAALRAMALVELCRRGRSVSLADSVPPRPEVVIVLRPGRSGCADGQRSLIDEVRSSRCTVDGSSRWRFDATSAVLADPRWRVACQSDLGEVRSLTSASRFATQSQRRALEVRDGGCVVPGCDAPPRWCDAHHVVEARLGGATDMSNLVLLCRRHHGVMHRRGWSMSIDDAQRVRWTTPGGDEWWGQRLGEVVRPIP